MIRDALRDERPLQGGNGKRVLHEMLAEAARNTGGVAKPTVPNPTPLFAAPVVEEEPETILLDIKIEKGVPLPVRRFGIVKYPYQEMDVGDSFFAPGLNGSQLSRNMSKRSRLKERKFTVRTVPGGARCWRIA